MSGAADCDMCPRCAMRYRDMKTGLTYRQVFEMMKDYSDDPADWKYKRRNTVLGKWRQIKLEYWAWHLDECERQHKWLEEQVALEAVPF